MNATPQIKVKGQLRHHFWGEYCATVLLKFENEEECKKGIEFLKIENPGTFRDACGSIRTTFKEFMQSPTQPALAANILGGDTLENLIEKFVSLGADKKKITSMAKSIDSGEPFEFKIQIK